MNYIFDTASRLAASQADAMHKSTLLAAETIHFLSQTLLRIVWSDEARMIFGSTIFYPLLAMTILSVVARAVPNRTVKKCKCYCLRKMLAIRNKVSAFMSKFDTDGAMSMIRRTQMLGSAKAFVGAVEVLLF